MAYQYQVLEPENFYARDIDAPQRQGHAPDGERGGTHVTANSILKTRVDTSHVQASALTAPPWEQTRSGRLWPSPG